MREVFIHIVHCVLMFTFNQLDVKLLFDAIAKLSHSNFKPSLNTEFNAILRRNRISTLNTNPDPKLPQFLTLGLDCYVKLPAVERF